MKINLNEDTAGIITLVEWTMMQDGQLYRYVWCAKWCITTDPDFGIKVLRTADRWQAVAVVGGNPAVILPGCSVKAWAYCPIAPRQHKTCYIIE